MNDKNLMGEMYQIKHRYRAIAYQMHISEELYLILCGVENCLPDYYFDTDGRAGYHLHVVLSGKGQLSVNGRVQDVRFGQMFITKPGEDTWYKADSEDPWAYCWMAFDGTQAKHIVEKAGFFDGVNVQDSRIEIQSFYTLVLKILDQAALTPSTIYSRTAYLLEFLSLAIDSYTLSDEQARTAHEYPTDTYVEYAKSFIGANFATAKISDVARYIGIHRSYLTNLFKAKVGVSPQEYLMQCKLNRACKLLVETGNPIGEISREIGYDNPLTFSKTFKIYYGVSPKEYRKRHKESLEENTTTE